MKRPKRGGTKQRRMRLRIWKVRSTSQDLRTRNQHRLSQYRPSMSRNQIKDHPLHLNTILDSRNGKMRPAQTSRAQTRTRPLGLGPARRTTETPRTIFNSVTSQGSIFSHSLDQLRLVQPVEVMLENRTSHHDLHSGSQSHYKKTHGKSHHLSRSLSLRL